MMTHRIDFADIGVHFWGACLSGYVRQFHRHPIDGDRQNRGDDGRRRVQSLKPASVA